MTRTRPSSSLALMALWVALQASAANAIAQPPALQDPNAKPADVWEAKLLTIDPAPELVPAFKHRLLPLSSENTPGDAAPMYLRLSRVIRDEAFLPMTRDAPAWLELPFETFPLGDSKSLVQSWTGRLKLIDIAARRSYCDWSYPVREQSRELIGILLPDVQELRSWSRLLSLKARVEIREVQFDEAIHTLQTGLAMGRHVGGGPFLINGLVGIAMCNSMIDRVEEFVVQPGAPNLYWALSALPQPMVSLRDAMELEQRLGENMVPELDAIDDGSTAQRTPEEWDLLLAGLFRNIQGLGRQVISEDAGNETLKAILSMDLNAFRAKFREESLAWARETKGLSEAAVAELPESRVLAEYISARYRIVRDAAFKATYLPYDQGRSMFEAAEKQIKAEKSSLVTAVAQMLPSVQSVAHSQVRLDRRIAALRVVEAIRMHAATHDGALPKSLDEIEVVPVPPDPVTNQPFHYEIDPDDATSALLTSGLIDNQPKSVVAYQIRLR